eukprot:8330350-Alexandrium_andersonii.AAC.1
MPAVALAGSIPAVAQPVHPYTHTSHQGHPDRSRSAKSGAPSSWGRRRQAGRGKRSPGVAA